MFSSLLHDKSKHIKQIKDVYVMSKSGRNTASAASSFSTFSFANKTLQNANEKQQQQQGIIRQVSPQGT